MEMIVTAMKTKKTMESQRNEKLVKAKNVCPTLVHVLDDIFENKKWHNTGGTALPAGFYKTIRVIIKGNGISLNEKDLNF